MPLRAPLAETHVIPNDFYKYTSALLYSHIIGHMFHSTGAFWVSRFFYSIFQTNLLCAWDSNTIISTALWFKQGLDLVREWCSNAEACKAVRTFLLAICKCHCATTKLIILLFKYNKTEKRQDKKRKERKRKEKKTK